MSKSVGLRTEILITLSLLLGAALLFGGLVMLRFTEASLLDERVLQLDSLTRIIAQSLGDGLQDRSTDKSKSILNSLPSNLHCQGWWIYNQNLDLDGSWVLSGNDQIAPLSAVRRHQIKLTGELIRTVDFPTFLNFFSAGPAQAQFIVPIKKNNHFQGVLEMSYSLNDIHLKLLTSQKMVVLYVLVYGLVLVLAGYYLLQRNIIKPALSLLQATVNVSQGNLETRLPTAGPAEISQLSAAYNHMVEALQQSQAEAKKHIATLEATNQKLQQTRDELVRSEKMASVGQLAAGLAHELGNPLAALIGYLELLKQRIKNISEKDIVERSIVEATRIDFLVRELLDFSRPGDEKSPLDIVNIGAELDSSAQLLSHQGVFTDIEVTLQVPALLPAIKINKNKLQQVLVNLLLNAAQACEKKNGKVTLTAGNDQNHLWILIEDNGAGIAKKDLSKIFDPFYTTKALGHGTGLGLAICQRIVAEVGGRIEVESSVGSGSQFKVAIPFSEHI